MPEGRFKSRTLRRVKKRLPGGNTEMRYEQRNPKRAVCAKCGSVLPGVPRGIPTEINRLSKTEKRPERPFGGVLCSKCLRDKIKQESRE